MVHPASPVHHDLVDGGAVVAAVEQAVVGEDGPTVPAVRLVVADERAARIAGARGVGAATGVQVR